jgi:hypothetical protein
MLCKKKLFTWKKYFAWKKLFAWPKNRLVGKELFAR